MYAFAVQCGQWNAKDEKMRQGMACHRARKLLQNPQVQAYVEELKAEAAARSVQEKFLTLEEKRAFLARVVRTPAAEVHENSDLASEIRPTQFGPAIKPVDKLGALQLDAKLAGELTDRVDVNVSPRIVDISKTLE
jgi:hypothetical protein